MRKRYKMFSFACALGLEDVHQLVSWPRVWPVTFRALAPYQQIKQSHNGPFIQLSNQRDRRAYSSLHVRGRDRTSETTTTTCGAFVVNIYTALTTRTTITIQNNVLSLSTPPHLPTTSFLCHPPADLDTCPCCLWVGVVMAAKDNTRRNKIARPFLLHLKQQLLRRLSGPRSEGYDEMTEIITICYNQPPTHRHIKRDSRKLK